MPFNTFAIRTEQDLAALPDLMVYRKEQKDMVYRKEQKDMVYRKEQKDMVYRKEQKDMVYPKEQKDELWYIAYTIIHLFAPFGTP